MRSIVCAALLLIACRSKPSGIEIVAKNAPSSVHFVRVYLGLSNVDSSSTFDNTTALTVPAPVSASTQGSATVSTTTENIFVHDPDGGNDIADYTDYKNGVTFDYQPNGDNEILAAIVVGYSGSGDTDIPIAGALVQPKPLRPQEVDVYTADLGSGATLPFLWNTYDDRTTPLWRADCAGISSGSGSAFIVMDGSDEDCDGYIDDTTQECSPFVYHDQAGISTTVTCLKTTPSSTNDTECRLGGAACQDGMGPNPTMCTPTDTCMPPIACTCSGAPGLGCLANPVAATADGFACSIGAPGGACAFELEPLSTGGMPCRTTGSRFGLALDGSDSFMPVVNDGSYQYTLVPNTACGASIQVMSSGGGNGSATATDTVLLMRLALINGAAMIVPVIVHVDPTATMCSTATDACVRPGGTVLAEPAFTQCVAGWGPRTSTGIFGTSPTLDAAMTSMYYIETSGEIDQAAGSGSAWTTGGKLGLTLINPPATAVHVTDDGNTLYVTDSIGTVEVFDKTSTGFPQTPNSMFTPGVTANAYSPNADNSDAFYSTAMGLMYEITPPDYSMPPNAVGAGQNPYMSEDETALFFAGSDTITGYSVRTQQRTGSGAEFSQPVAIPELGSGATPEFPWVEPVSLTAPNTQHLFYSSDDDFAGSATIYWVQRAPLLLP
jgi:hypothetical protein